MSSSVSSSAPGKPWEPPTPDELAPELPQYEILGLLGRGGMGAVYRARQRSLKREVAIKVLPPTIEESGMQFAERFKAEAEAMARLNHPGVVAVYDAGETPGGLLYIVMEFVEGTDVSQMIRSSGKLPPDYAYSIAAHVCDALAYAHANGLIHRDIKPANIMVDTQGRVKVADFGLAKMTNEGSGLTQTNMAVGTPDFVAPEAFYPGVPLDGRADLYAVGVMLYQMLTGSIPRGAFKPASVIVPGVDARFDQIVLKAMQVDREERYSSAVELRQSLDTLLVPMEQPAPSGQEQASMSGGLSQPGMTGAQTVATPQQSAASTPQSRPMPRPVGSPRQTYAPPPKPKAPLFLGLVAVAAIAVGAFVIFTKKHDNVENTVASDGTAAESKPSVPATASSTPAIPAATNDAPKSVATAPSPAKPVAAAPAPAMPVPAPVVPPPAITKPTTPSANLPPEVAALDAQFIQLQEERVTKPFEAGVSQLNTGYLGGITRKIAEEKAAGHLDAILGLEAEQKLLAAKQPVPETDDVKTPESLKALRTIYRDAYAKLVAARVENLAALIAPLDKRLEQMEAQFTKADRLPDAKTVRGYREVLAESRSDLQSAAASPSPSRPSPGALLAPATVLALKDGFINSLGMKFMPVKGTDVLFCIHETRYKDYAAYAAETQDVDGSWRDQNMDGFTPGENPDEHPATKLLWDDARKFCAWLSKKEGKTYRLPTDEEWSIAAGLGRAENRSPGATPAMLSCKENTMFPWGGTFPPSEGEKVGNYSDASRKSKAPNSQAGYLEDYDDGFPTTAPVMSFKPNQFGLYDMGGNVWEWCEDWLDSKHEDHVLRGGGWHDFATGSILSSARGLPLYGTRYYHIGFRVVLVSGGAPVAPAAASVSLPPAPAPVAPAPAAPLSPSAALALKNGLTNSLGMKFLPVPDTKVLFCIHETRHADYTAYANEVPRARGWWEKQQKFGVPCGQGDDEPVVGVTWDEAKAFCAWLSKKEGKTYRLPTDREWSLAAGIGHMEGWTKDTTPEMLNEKLAAVFPWGKGFPPRTKDLAGNYADTSWHQAFPNPAWMNEKYNDGFATTAPVMSFKPNELGLYDMGGNASEWTEDWWNDEEAEKVRRGGSLLSSDEGGMLSSNRAHNHPGYRYCDTGFRVVVEME